MKVGVIDYGVGNLGSVLRAIEELRVTPLLVNRAIDLHAADCLILPGVGNFADCMNLLEAGGWVSALRDEVQGYNRPLLGICVGMQLLADRGFEGAETPEGVSGLGFVPGEVVHLKTLGSEARVPHVGWNGISCPRRPEFLFEGIPDETDFYFVHSYAFVLNDENDRIATVDYGIPVTAAVGRGRVWGTQFHPEKSSRAGFQLLRNFFEGQQC